MTLCSVDGDLLVAVRYCEWSSVCLADFSISVCLKCVRFQGGISRERYWIGLVRGLFWKRILLDIHGRSLTVYSNCRSWFFEQLSSCFLSLAWELYAILKRSACSVCYGHREVVDTLAWLFSGWEKVPGVGGGEGEGGSYEPPKQHFSSLCLTNKLTCRSLGQTNALSECGGGGIFPVEKCRRCQQQQEAEQNEENTPSRNQSPIGESRNLNKEERKEKQKIPGMTQVRT